jgi:hypothetical protein
MIAWSSGATSMQHLSSAYIAKISKAKMAQTTRQSYPPDWGPITHRDRGSGGGRFKSNTVRDKRVIAEMVSLGSRAPDLLGMPDLLSRLD